MCPTKEDYCYLNDALGLANYFDQDWELCVCEKHRVQEFIDFYLSKNLSNTTKQALMSLIIASYDLYLEEYPDEYSMWSFIHKILSVEGDLHWHTIFYWSCESDGANYEGWNVTRRMRELNKL